VKGEWNSIVGGEGIPVHDQLPITQGGSFSPDEEREVNVASRQVGGPPIDRGQVGQRLVTFTDSLRPTHMFHSVTGRAQTYHPFENLSSSCLVVSPDFVAFNRVIGTSSSANFAEVACPAIDYTSEKVPILGRHD